MTRVARGLVERGLSAATFDFPYMAARRKVPDRAGVLEACWRGALEAARAELPDVPLFVGGKSMGGRIASHLAAGDHEPIAGLVFLGYPLHPPGRPDQRRDAHLPAITEPMLFVQGSRDAFGTSAELEELLPRLQRAELFVVPGGDHSFKVPGTKGDGTIVRVIDEVARWMKAVAAT